PSLGPSAGTPPCKLSPAGGLTSLIANMPPVRSPSDERTTIGIRCEIERQAAARSKLVEPKSRPPPCAASAIQSVERLLEAVRVRALGLRERLEPVGDLVEALVAGGLRHARVHVGVLVRLAGDRCLQVIGRRADRQAR